MSSQSLRKLPWCSFRAFEIVNSSTKAIQIGVSQVMEGRQINVCVVPQSSVNIGRISVLDQDKLAAWIYEYKQQQLIFVEEFAELADDSKGLLSMVLFYEFMGQVRVKKCTLSTMTALADKHCTEMDMDTLYLSSMESDPVLPPIE